MTFQELFESYVLASADHQEHAQEVLGGKPFSADLAAGTVEIGDVRARAELIGTEAEDQGSWLWGWANRSGFGDHVLRAARHAREVGERDGIGELTTAELPLDGSIGYRCTVVACGLAGGFVYYPAQAAPGTTALLLLDAPELELPPVRFERTMTVLNAVVSSGLVTDWPHALRSYGELRRLRVPTANRRYVRLEAEDGSNADIWLDDQGRIENVEATIRSRGSA